VDQISHTVYCVAIEAGELLYFGRLVAGRLGEDRERVPEPLEHSRALAGAELLERITARRSPTEATDVVDDIS
jgi:hypothetical protein